MKSLPSSMPDHTDHLIMDNSNLNLLCDSHHSFAQISSISLEFCNISEVCEDFIRKVIIRKTGTFYLSNNKLTSLQEVFTNTTKGTRLYLSNNPYNCGCDMVWMIKWIKSSILSGMIPDYQNVTCHSGFSVGTPIHQLDPLEMKCGESWFTLLVTLAVSIGLSTVVMVISIILINRSWEEIRWISYKYFHTFLKSGDKEDIEAMQFDALISYRYF